MSAHHTSSEAAPTFLATTGEEDDELLDESDDDDDEDSGSGRFSAFFFCSGFFSSCFLPFSSTFLVSPYETQSKPRRERKKKTHTNKKKVIETRRGMRPGKECGYAFHACLTNEERDGKRKEGEETSQWVRSEEERIA